MKRKLTLGSIAGLILTVTATAAFDPVAVHDRGRLAGPDVKIQEPAASLLVKYRR